ncbi:hypothetical protein [Kocuria rosea]|uniref:hypothetical protein n=1 Tax=Kocuria rosea TaxID=1275 RepID=UPI000D64391B|nr:hypothetical protein [Kocuria rosea]PWF85606.1 hypothetical protein DEJ37_11480 [Kocuria rosea]STX01846.1 Uncharacterised protein [Kocuria rosea]
MTETAAPTGSVWSHVLGYVSVIGPPATVVTALVFYFGWARAKAQAEWMGLHVNLFGYTTRDFALLSISALYLPLLLLIALAMLWVWLDRLLRRRIDRGAAGRWATTLPRAALLGAGALIGLMVVLLFAERVYSPLYAPYLVTAGVLVAAWAVRIRRCAAAVEGPRRPAEQQAVEATLLLVLVALLLFRGTSNFAEARGRGLAEDLEVNLPWLPRAQVYSQEPLGLDVPGVTTRELGTAEAPLYRYDGLRLLTVSGERYFFLHEGWSVEEGTVVVLPDDASLRVQYGR